MKHHFAFWTEKQLATIPDHYQVLILFLLFFFILFILFIFYFLFFLKSAINHLKLSSIEITVLDITNHA